MAFGKTIAAVAAAALIASPVLSQRGGGHGNGFQGGRSGGGGFRGGAGFRGGNGYRGGGFRAGGSYRGGGRSFYRGGYGYRGWAGGYRPYYGFNSAFGLGVLGGYAFGAYPYGVYEPSYSYSTPYAYAAPAYEDYHADVDSAPFPSPDAPPPADRSGYASPSDDQAASANGDHCPMYWDEAAARYIARCD